jgi:hypothetical protein
MPTVAECRTKAHELTALAEREPELKSKHLNDAAGWLLLANRTAEMESQDDPTPKESS